MLQISNLQISKPQSLNGIVGLPNLTALGAVNPQMLSQVSEFIYGIRSQQQAGNVFIKNYTKKRIVDSAVDIEWVLSVPSAKTIGLVEARIGGSAVTSASQAGAGRSSFKLVFPERYFFENDVIASEAGPAYQIRVMDDGLSEGTNYVYECSLQSQTNSETYIPYDYLIGGRSFSRLYAPTERSLGTKGSGFNYTGNIKMRNQFMGLRYEDLIPGDIIANKGAIKMNFDVTEENGKKTTFSVWELYAEYERKLQLARHENFALWNARYNKDSAGNIVDIGKNGIARPNASGIEEQIYSGTKERFIVPSLDMFEEAILAVCDKRDFTTSSEIVMRTGYWGAIKFQKLVEAKASSFSPLLGSQFAPEDKNGGFNFKKVFTAYTLPNGAVLRVFVDSTLDDKSIAFNQLPMGNGLPGNAFSYTYNIINVGTEGGEANIEVVYANSDMYTYLVQPGVTYANHYTTGNLATIPDNGVKVNYITPQFTVKVMDPSRCLSFLPASINV